LAETAGKLVRNHVFFGNSCKDFSTGPRDPPRPPWPAVILPWPAKAGRCRLWLAMAGQRAATIGYGYGSLSIRLALVAVRFWPVDG
jgi:hypothetical protein